MLSENVFIKNKRSCFLCVLVFFVYILPAFKEFFEPNMRFTLAVYSDVCDFDVHDSDVRDGPKQIRTLRRL